MGRYLRGRRDLLGLSLKVVASKAGMSSDYLGRVERGTQQIGLDTLSNLFDALDVDERSREFLVKLAHPTLLDSAQKREPRAYGAAHAHDLIDLQTSPYPHALMRWPLFDVIACNAAFEAAFPGLTAGGNVVEWVMLNPQAPLVLPDWAAFAHGMVHSLRFAPKPNGEVAQRFATIVDRCAGLPRWDQFWNTYPPDPGGDSDVILLRTLSSDEQSRHIVRIDKPEFPANIWHRYRLIPYPGDAAVAA
ncbi:helix-turn-helix domain-containing protein [Nocardia fluminea]|uniref:helix-turn-helix domain-containing protein n=1 Tax=Nocardia fluminea TaxID=134984 RepID=UPI003659B15C